MDAIFCGGCGAKLEEAPTLLPDQWLPCPPCGSLARQFEQDVNDQIARSDRGTAWTRSPSRGPSASRPSCTQRSPRRPEPLLRRTWA
jgi:hypothetical protein